MKPKNIEPTPKKTKWLDVVAQKQYPCPYCNRGGKRPHESYCVEYKGD